MIPEPLPPGVILLEEQIKQLVEAGQLIDEKTFDARSLDSCSYDVRIGSKGIIGGDGREINLTESPLTVSPGGYAAVISYEKVRIPNNILARINSKRTMAYQGLALLTGTQVDPGYKGHLLFGFYNTSSKKVVLRYCQPICSLVFEVLLTEVTRPKPSDPDLLAGNFPGPFVNNMANMEVMSWQELSTQIRRLDDISKQIIDLRSQYKDVLEPIRAQTENINKLSVDVERLRESLALVAKRAEIHDDKISSLSDRISNISGQSKIIWAIILVAVGAVIAWVFARFMPSILP